MLKRNLNKSWFARTHKKRAHLCLALYVPMKFIPILILFFIFSPVEARSNWTSLLKCPDLSARYKSESGLIEIETLTTTKDNLVIKACIYLEGGDCFKLIPKETVVVSSGYDFRVSSIEVQMDNYYKKVCTYEVNDL